MEIMPPIETLKLMATPSVCAALDLDEVSSRDMVDLFGLLRANEAAFKKQRMRISAELVRRNVTPVEGSLFRGVIIPENLSSTLDRKKIEEEMGERWISRFLKFGKVRSAFFKITGSNLDGGGDDDEED